MSAVEVGQEVVSTWTKVEVIAEAAGSVGVVFTLFYSLWSFRTTLRDSYYAELDRVYFELLKIGLEHPDLLDFPGPPDPGKAQEYDAYAFMVWNFVETVYDRCQGWSKRRLRDTWYPVIAAENARHRAWFDLRHNRLKFKDHFCRFIDANYPPPRSSPEPPGPSSGPSSAPLSHPRPDDWGADPGPSAPGGR